MKFVFIYIIQQAEPFWNHYNRQPSVEGLKRALGDFYTKPLLRPVIDMYHALRSRFSLHEEEDGEAGLEQHVGIEGYAWVTDSPIDFTF